jgi:Spy/CpxP family protein refolding chaperone
MTGMLKSIRAISAAGVIGATLVCGQIAWAAGASAANPPTTKPAVAIAPTTKPALTHAPTTKPAVGQPAANAMRPGPAYVIKRMRDAAAGIELSDEQKPKMDAAWEQVNKEGLALSDELGRTLPGQRFQKLMDFSRQIRVDLAAVLTDDQLSTLDDRMKSFSIPRQPNRPGGNGGPNGVAIMGNIQQALANLDLTDDQKQQIKEVMDQVRPKVADLRQKLEAGQNVDQDLQGIRNLLRDKLKGILSQDQLQSLADALQQYRSGGGGNGAGGNTGGARGGKPAIAEVTPEDLLDDGPALGAAAPNVKIIEINGRPFDPESYKGHVVVIEFGSMSCPVFRQHVKEMEKLKAAEGGRAFFMLVYTREAFPAGEKEVERNRNQGISISDARTLDERKAQALKTQQQLHITYQMAIDSMDNAASTAFGAFPNGTVVIGKDGTISARQRWTNPDTLKMAIDDAVIGNEAPVASVR